LLPATRGDKELRWICVFKPDPALFKVGVDIDDALSAFPLTFKILRTFEKRSFIQLPDVEAEALQMLILRRNRDALTGVREEAHRRSVERAFRSLQSRITPRHHLDIRPVLRAASPKGVLQHEMALEAAVLWQLL
jgi:hypothetical protein